MLARDRESDSVQKPAAQNGNLTVRHDWVRAIFVLLFCGLAACSKPDPIEQEILSLQGRTMPPGARLVEETKLLRETSSLSASWEYETEWDWQKYSVWVSGRLPAAYGTKIGGTTKLHFRAPFTR
jgi:hypothetical protein